MHYRVNGLSQGPGEQVMIGNRVIAKISRSEVAEKFMRPPPERILAKLVQENRITETQARLASRVPMAIGTLEARRACVSVIRFS